jgi:hypothetical protein
MVAVKPSVIFKIDGEWRPRFEFRDGYRTLPSDTSHPAAFISQRSRLNLFFKKDKFSTFLSIQDVRVWGDHEFRDVSGTISTFQAWAELSLTKKISARFGRQTLIYDNERLFAQNNWRQNGGSHDALMFKYRSSATEADLVVAFNQAAENVFETDYRVLQSKGNYKFLTVQWFSHRFNEKFNLNVLNVSDGFQSNSNPENMYLRVTNGGRIEYTGKTIYATFSGYYQWGKNPDHRMISAYYFQPEIKFSGIKNFDTRLGMEYMSGQEIGNSKFNSFVPLYGVAHRFMGYMDYFIRFPEDTKGAGLVNPYWMNTWEVSKKISLKADFHLFYSQKDYLYKGALINKYLGFENDLLFLYKPSKEITAEVGYSWMLAEESMEIIRGGNKENFPHWLYLMVTVKPELFKFEK